MGYLLHLMFRCDGMWWKGMFLWGFWVELNTPQVALIEYNATSCLGTCGQEDGRMHDAMRRVEGWGLELSLIIFRVISDFGSKNISSCPTHNVVGSGRVRVGSGWPAILCLIFWLYQIFLSFGSNIPARTRPVTWSGRVGSGRVFFERVGSG